MENTKKIASSNKENILGTEKVGKLLMKFSVPGIIALVVNALYNIVDQIFIGQGVGYLGNGATNVIFPLTTFAMAFSLMIGDGTASFISLMLGKKEEHKAAKGAAAGMIFAVVAGCILAVLYSIFLPSLCRLFGATDAILPYALQYGGISALGLPFLAICSGYASIIRADGSPKYNMIGLLAGCLINLVGDPIFIFVFHWGVAGAAWATILGQIANAAINLAYIPRMKSVKVTRKEVKGSFPIVPQILKLGISSFISQMVLVIVMAVQNNFLKIYGAESEYGADIPISALGVTMKVFSILMVICIGLASGAQPIWGYNYGARLYKRVKETFNRVIVIATIVMIFAFLLFQFFPMSIVRIFGAADESYNKFAIQTLKVFLLLVPISGFQLSAGIFFQSVGRPILASLISLSKQIIFMIPALFILCPKVGVEGVLWAGPVADGLSFLLTVCMLTLSWKRIFKDEDDLSDRAAEKDSAESPKIDSDSRLRYFINHRPTVITIGRSYGAGGREIGKKLADLYKVPYYDSEIIKEAAAESGLNAMFLASVDEEDLPASVPPVSMVVGTNQSDLKAIRRAAEEAEGAVIEKIAANGSCVIVGRRADQILKGKTPVFSVFVDCDENARAKKIAKNEGLSEKEALKKLRDIDKKRSSYYNFTTKGSWGRSSNYDLTIDTGKNGIEGAVKIIQAAL